MQAMVHMLHLKIVHHYLHVRQKLMLFLLMKQIIFVLQCLCTIWVLWQFKKDEVADGNADLAVDDNGIFNSQSFKYKAALAKKTVNADGRNSFVKNMKIVLPLKHLSNFWRSLEMLLINCKIRFQ